MQDLINSVQSLIDEEGYDAVLTALQLVCEKRMNEAKARGRKTYAELWRMRLQALRLAEGNS